ncbi:type I restriction-modification system specificity subunit [Clostridium tetani]|uniref:restriction endonuclease subunit S n=1 Tax=Clostridium tetani TaxID=1513 RepID=UPI000D2078F4|nr:restriction endonuclease subunit S [Clostridium tetani]AVP53944.1 hypothetical protein C3B72_01960 [Clostridium tetani]RXI77682.1 hypothetical protein DP128_02225 [Clostridium tetani]RXM57439.1 hypothetical protein DP133_10045 [Clostridium tetani]WFN61553.1 restriction endonuclease subunit S [Clostridium tetani]SUY57381.1 type I restriction-modification system specificity subunit [Clostridium tetani]
MILKKIKIKDIGRVVTGTTPATKIQEYYGNEFDFIKPSYIEKGTRFFCESETKLSTLAKEEYANTFVPPLSTCVVTIGSIGEKMCLTKDVCLTNQQINTIIPNGNYDKVFIYYLMKHNLYKVKAANSGSSSGRENVSKSIFENLEVEVPDLISQQKISKILSSYDDLIENNLKRIKLLEETAELIYKEWFVNFRFPGHEKCEFVDGIPKGWQNKSVLDDFDFIKGFEPGTKNYIYELEHDCIKFLRVGDLSGRDSNIYISNQIEKKRIIDIQDIVISLDGTVGVVKFGLSGAYSSGIRKIEIKNNLIGNMFTYCMMRSEKIQSTIIAYSKGTTIIHAGSSIEYMKYIYPEKYILESFNKLCEPIFKKILNLQLANEKLKEARDILIPKLIMGEIEV